MKYVPLANLPSPRCCADATDGEMVRTDAGWLCVWCGREADSLEQYRQLKPPSTPTAAVMPRGALSLAEAERKAQEIGRAGAKLGTNSTGPR